MTYTTCDTKNIRVMGSVREFRSVDELLESGVSSPLEVELTGITYRDWWNRLTVAFPDRSHCSSAMVEVQGKTVNIGTPNNYVTVGMDSSIDALRLAEKINVDWLAFDGIEDAFIDAFDWEKYAK